MSDNIAFQELFKSTVHVSVFCRKTYRYIHVCLLKLQKFAKLSLKKNSVYNHSSTFESKAAEGTRQPRGLLTPQFVGIKFHWNCCSYCITEWEKLILIYLDVMRITARMDSVILVESEALQPQHILEFKDNNDIDVDNHFQIPEANQIRFLLYNKVTTLSLVWEMYFITIASRTNHWSADLSCCRHTTM